MQGGSGVDGLVYRQGDMQWLSSEICKYEGSEEGKWIVNMVGKGDVNRLVDSQVGSE